MNFLNIDKDKQSANLDLRVPDDKKVRIRTIGGTETVTGNLTLYEYGDEILVVDCGIGFPDIVESPGVDVLIPDFTYLAESFHKVKGIFVTHDHEDHIGAIPYFLKNVGKVPIYSTKLSQEFLKAKLNERKFKNLSDGLSLNIINPDSGEVTLGNFRIRAIGVNHSVPEAQGYVITTPAGVFMHMAEYKFDPTPVLGKPTDEATIERYGREGVLCLLSDCLLSTVEGSTQSEKILENTFNELFQNAQGRQLFVTTMSSNVSRMYQIISAGIKFGRKIVPSGMSVEQMVEIGRNLGYLPFGDNEFVLEKNAYKFPQSDLLYLIAGCYGQRESSLGRLSRGEHKDIKLEDRALVIFSGDPSPPGTDVMVEKLTDALILAGADVVYGEVQENLHVSGHGTKKDLEKMAKMVNPKYFIPLGGTVTKMRAYTNMLSSIGFYKDRVFECLGGESVEFFAGKAKKGPKIEIKDVYINSDSEIVNPVVVREREVLSSDGVFVVVIPQTKKGGYLTGKIEIITRGFVYVRDSEKFMDRSRKFITKRLGKHLAESKQWSDIKRKLERDLDKFLYNETGGSPLILVHSMGI